MRAQHFKNKITRVSSEHNLQSKSKYLTSHTDNGLSKKAKWFEIVNHF